MAPASIENGSSQQLMAQAAQKLLDAVKEFGPGNPSPFATALLELMENSAKLQQFDEMLAAANEEAVSEEAKTWQQISLMTLQYARKTLVEEQQSAVRRVCDLAQQGASLYPTAIDAVAKPVAKEEPKESKAAKAPLTPPGVWAVRPPPGLEPPASGVESPAGELGSALPPPPGLQAPPGLNAAPSAAESKPEKKLPPWRKAGAKGSAATPVPKKAEPEAAPEAAPEAVSYNVLNFDAYSDDEDE